MLDEELDSTAVKEYMHMKKDLGVHAGVIPESVFVIATYDKDGTPDAMNAAWGMQCAGDEIAINIGSHQTTDNIKETQAFTIAPADASHLAEADYFGIATGRKVNKAKASGLTFEHAKNVNAPIIKELPVTMECKVVHFDDMDGETRIVGKVVNTVADESVLDEKGNVDFDKLHPIIFDPQKRAYRSVGPIAGEAWHSGRTFMQD